MKPVVDQPLLLRRETHFCKPIAIASHTSPTPTINATAPALGSFQNARTWLPNRQMTVILGARPSAVPSRKSLQLHAHAARDDVDQHEWRDRHHAKRGDGDDALIGQGLLDALLDAAEPNALTTSSGIARRSSDAGLR